MDPSTVSTSSRNFLGNSMVNIEDCGWCNKLRNWAIDTAQYYLTTNHNDLRALPKTVRLQILVVLSSMEHGVPLYYSLIYPTMLIWLGRFSDWSLGKLFAMYAHLSSSTMHRKNL